ncbi:mannosyltransferase family protein [Streptomyces sp. NPDC005322]|uniref:mannosyltransferase family protein n=1 Tax=unclassified Streptomyces TaxID=2593676 RepID=UPI0033A0762B
MRHAAPAILGYAAVRLLGIAVLTKWAHLKGHGVWPQLAYQWDSKWYLGIADDGYAHVLTSLHSNLAFFPLYPMLVKAIAAVTPGSSASVGLLLSLTASLIAAWGIFAVGDRLHGRRVGVVLAVLWGATPVAIVQSMGYTESLFTALTAWSLYAVLTERWVWAGWLALLAGLTRPTGVAVAAAVSITAMVALIARRRAKNGGTSRKENDGPPANGKGPAPTAHPARIALGGLLAPLGWLGYLGWVGHRLGRWDGYFAAQRTWTNEWDGGADTLRALRWILAYEPRPQMFLIVVSLCLVAAPVLYALSLAARQPLPLLVFTGVLLLIVLGSGGVYFPRARFLLPGFPLLLPAAVAIVRASARTRALVLGGVVLSSAYLGAYMALVWPSAP